MFGKLLFFFVFPKLGISYKVKKWLRHFMKNLRFFVNLCPSGDGISYKVKKLPIRSNSNRQFLFTYSSQFFTVLGNGTTSLIFPIPVRYITHLSNPRPNPAWRAEP